MIVVRYFLCFLMSIHLLNIVSGELLNPDFELSYYNWTTSGPATSILNSSALCHTGHRCAQTGKSTRTFGISSFLQTFTAPANSKQISFWYSQHCSGDDDFVYSVATLTDVAAGTSSQIMRRSCASLAVQWRQVFAPITAGRQYTINISTYEDGTVYYPAYTLYDTFSFLNVLKPSFVPTQDPTYIPSRPTALPSCRPTYLPTSQPTHHNVTGVLNPCFESGNFSGWQVSGNATVIGDPSGYYALFGNTDTRAYANITQTFVTYSTSKRIEITYKMLCNSAMDGIIRNNWATAYLIDSRSNVTITILPQTCHNTSDWTVAFADLKPNRKYTLVLASLYGTYESSADAYDGDMDESPPYTLFGCTKILDNFSPTVGPTSHPTAPSVSPSIIPSVQPSYVPTIAAPFIPGDFPLPVVTAKSAGALFAASPVCTTGACAGSSGDFTPSVAQLIKYQNISVSGFTSTYYDFGSSSATQSASFSLGGTTVGQISSPAFTYNAPCTQLNQIVKTSTVYVDDFTVAVRFAASDSIGRLRCAYTSVTFTITNGVSVLYTGSCTQTGTNPTGQCTYTGTDKTYFTGRNLTTVVTMNAAGLSQPMVTTGNVFFYPAPTALSSYDNLRSYISLPKHPVYAGDLITVPIYLYSPTQVIDALQLYIYYPSQLSYVSGSLTTTSYTTATAGTSTAGQIIALFNKVLSPSQAVGFYQLGQLQFVVSGSSSTAIQITGTLTSMTTTDGILICAKNQAGSQCSSTGRYGNYFSGSTDDIYFLDMVGAPGHTPGSLSLITPSVVGLYATSSYVNLVNTAGMTGTPVTDNLLVFGALSTYRSSFADTQISASSLTCAVATGQPNGVLNVAPYSGNRGCLISATSANTVGSAAYTVTASYSGYTVNAAYRVYVPSAFVMRGTRRSLRRISRCLFESSYINVLATLTADASNTLSNVDVTSLVTLTVSDNFTATYSATSHVLQGLSMGRNGGVVSLIPTGPSKNISITNNTFHVSSFPGKITGMYTFAYSGSSVSNTPSYSETVSSNVVSVSASLPAMNDQTTYSGTQPLTNFAKLVTFAQSDDGYFTDVSQYSGLRVTSKDSQNVNASVYKDASGNVIYWYAYVPSNAASSSGNVLVSTLKDTCGRVVTTSNTTQQGYIFTTAGIPYGVTVTPATNKLTSPGSCASKAPISLPTQVQLAVNLLMKSASGASKPPKVMTSDSRTQYTIVHTDPGVSISVSAVGLIQVSSNSTSGKATISITFPRYSGGAGIQGNVTVSVVECTNSLSLTTIDFPGKQISPFTTLKLMHCSGHYQSSFVRSFIKMTDNSQYEVTAATLFSSSSPSTSILHTTTGAVYGTSPGGVIVRASTTGTFSINGTYCNSWATVSFTAAGTASLTSLTNYQYGPTSAQQPLNAGFPTSVYTVSTSSSIGCGATSTTGCVPSALNLNFNDGTVVLYSQLASIQATPNLFLVFSSNDPNYVFVNTSTGALSARQNSYQYATVTANVFCLTAQSTSISVYPVAANLYPADNDIKTGYIKGLPYVQYVNHGVKMVEITIQVKPKAGFLIGAWNVFFYFRTSDLNSGSINVTYTGHPGSKDVWSPAVPAPVSLLQSDNSISYVQPTSSSYTSLCTSTLPSTSGGLTLVATLHIPTTSLPTISYFLTQVTGLILNPIGNTALSAQVTVADSSNAPFSASSKGFINLNNGTVLESPIALKRRALQDAVEPSDRSTSRHLTWNDATFILTGDISGNSLLGYEDVIGIQNLYAKATSVTYGLTALRNAVPTLSYMPATSTCGQNYCNYGSGYTTSIVSSVLSTADVRDLTYSYLYNAPLLQFPFSQTPCDMATLLPNSNPQNLLQLDAFFYSPPTNVRSGGPIQCQSNLYKISVYFETNYKLSQIARVVSGGTAVSYNPGSTIIGPATCNGNGLFTVTLQLNKTVPDAGHFTAAVYYSYSDSGFNTTFFWLTDTSSTRRQSTDYTPIYDSNFCPSFPSIVPTSIPSQVPSAKPTAPTVQPSKRPSQIPSARPTVSPSIMPTTLVYTHSVLNFTQVLNYVAYCNQTLHNPGIKDGVTRVLMYTLRDVLAKYVNHSITVLDLKISDVLCETLGLNSTVLKTPPKLLPVSNIPSNAPTSFPSNSGVPSSGPTAAPTSSTGMPTYGPNSPPHAIASRMELQDSLDEEFDKYQEDLASHLKLQDSAPAVGSATFGAGSFGGTDDAITKFQQVFTSMDANYRVFFTVASTNSTYLKKVYDDLFRALGKGILSGDFDTYLQAYAKKDSTQQYGLKAFLYARSGQLKVSGNDVIAQRFLSLEPTIEPTVSIEPSSQPLLTSAPTKLKVPNITAVPSSVRVVTNSVASTSTSMASGLIAGIVIISTIAIVAVLYIVYRVSNPPKYEDAPPRNPDEVPSQYNPRHSSVNNMDGRNSGEGRGSSGNGNAPSQSKMLSDAFKSVRRTSAPNTTDLGMRATTLANQTEPADM